MTKLQGFVNHPYKDMVETFGKPQGYGYPFTLEFRWCIPTAEYVPIMIRGELFGRKVEDIHIWFIYADNIDNAVEHIESRILGRDK